MFPSDIKYKTFDGKIGIAPIACINKISNGNYYAVYEVKGKLNSSQEKVNHLERLARRRGFRVKIIETERSYNLEIFGDKQEDVDEFVELCNLPEVFLV
ncbi:MAG: hypothetical protein ACFFB8_18165 [Promethearchaeota archaeon]